jgi:alkylation response protein AidB-like acyl-CoA dehydrogenase
MGHNARAARADRAMLERASATESSDCVDRARSIASVIAAHAGATEAARALAPEVLDALHGARLFRMLIPRSCGGLEVDPLTYMQSIEEIAKADGSAAWCVVQGSGCSVASAYLAPEVAREIFGSPRAVMASGPFGPDAKAIAVEGGYRVSGSGSFASGIKHAQWLGCHCLIYEADGTPRLAADGTQAERTMLFPKSSARLKDMWNVIGLKGTGSDNYTIDDLFVPAAFSFTRESAADRREGGPLYRIPVYHYYGVGFAALALGLARAALDDFVKLASAKRPSTRVSLLRDNAVIQSQVALAEAKLASARSYLVQTLRECWETAKRGDVLSMPQRATLKLAGTYAAHQGKDVIDAVYHAAGATAIFASGPFERRFRDVHTVLQQVQAQFVNFELVGQVLLGLPSQTKLI